MKSFIEFSKSFLGMQMGFYLCLVTLVGGSVLPMWMLYHIVFLVYGYMILVPLMVLYWVHVRLERLYNRWLQR